jgi:hypothetical protein
MKGARGGFLADLREAYSDSGLPRFVKSVVPAMVILA